MRVFAFAAPLMLIATLASAAPFTGKTSPHDVATTMDRLAAAVEAAGATIFARIDHAAGAVKVGQELAPNQVLRWAQSVYTAAAKIAAVSAA